MCTQLYTHIHLYHTLFQYTRIYKATDNKTCMYIRCLSNTQFIKFFKWIDNIRSPSHISAHGTVEPFDPVAPNVTTTLTPYFNSSNCTVDDKFHLIQFLHNNRTKRLIGHFIVSSYNLQILECFSFGQRKTTLFRNDPWTTQVNIHTTKSI